MGLLDFIRAKKYIDAHKADNALQLNDIDKAKADIIRNQRHSGVVNYLPITTGSTTNLNSITIPETTYPVNGYEIKMPLTVVTLPTAPTTGTWEDLVFLETYFPSTGNGYTMAGRYRTVSNVNFITYPQGFIELDPYAYGDGCVRPQGGNTQPVVPVTLTTWTTRAQNTFHKADGSLSNYSSVSNFNENDKGLFIAGDGTSVSKSYFLTYDGYSYAIPLFRVKRRNSSGFSPANPNGAKTFKLMPINIVTVSSGYTAQWTFVNTIDYDSVNVGDSLFSGFPVKILSKDGSNKITIFTNVGWGTYNNVNFNVVSDHPQSPYSNVIDSRDITDLRHETKAQYNYDYIARKADDQFKRGELSPKKLLATHHGIPKSEVDANTVFYASLDATLVPEFPLASSAMNLGTGSFKPMPTGSGYKFNGDSVTPIEVSGLSAISGTIDLLVNFTDFNSTIANRICTFADSNGYSALAVNQASNKKLNFYIYSSTLGTNTVIQVDTTNLLGSHKVRLTWTLNGTMKVIIDNTLFGSISYTLQMIQPTQLVLGASRVGLGAWSSSGTVLTMADFSISNIDRGVIDYQLPPDFISGDAIIMPAYTDQRRILSQSQTTQTTSGIVKVGTTGSNRGLTTSRASGSWTSADTITIIGMAGELISGVFDADTALARIVSADTTNNTITLDTLSAISDNDVVSIFLSDMSPSYTGVYVKVIDATNKIIELYQDIGLTIKKLTYSTWINGKILETTASSSVPLAYHMVAGVKTAVVGTWATLGTNVATFTLGTNAGLTTQDIQIDYSMIMPAGQPALSVPTTITLMGEAGFRLPYANQTIVSDYANKVSGRTWENPNIAKTLSGIVANNPAPSAFVNELITSEYAKMFVQDGTVTTFSTSVNGEQACILLGFDLIKIAERKLGCKIPRKTVADKVAWLKAGNITSITANILCNGSSPMGSKETLATWNLTTWSGFTPIISTSSSIVTLTKIVTVFTTFIDVNGFVHYTVYSDPSDGVTPSTINVDYASLDLKFQDKIVNSFSLATGQTVDVRDDFAGKISGSVVENPNKGYYGFSIGSLKTPTSFTLENTDGTGNLSYTVISTLDGTLKNISSSTNGEYSQQLFSFNLIRIVEDKMGTIPAIDKKAWLIENTTIKSNWYGYGSSPTGNNAKFSVFNVVANLWGGTTNHTGGSVQNLSILTTSANISNYITADGFVHFLAYADPSDGVTASTIYTDYCNIELTFKKPTGYDVLSSSNPRRDAGLSSILFVRKETKEVQSLFPYSNEFMLTTYSEYLEAPIPISANTDVTILAEIPEFLITDLGSAVGNKQGTHHWMNLAYRVGQDNLNLYGELGFSVVKFAPDSKDINVGSKVTVNATGFSTAYWKQYALATISKPMVGIARYLVLHNSELKLLIFSKYSATGGLTVDGTGVGILVSLPGKPLSKEAEGLVRAGVNTPTAWKSGELIPMGLVDKTTGKIITTNNSI